MQMGEAVTQAQTSSRGTGPITQAATSSGATASEFVLNIPYAKGTLSVRIKVTGDEMRPSHLARARKYLELAESDWGSDLVDGAIGGQPNSHR